MKIVLKHPPKRFQSSCVTSSQHLPFCLRHQRPSLLGHSHRPMSTPSLKTTNQAAKTLEPIFPSSDCSNSLPFFTAKALQNHPGCFYWTLSSTWPSGLHLHPTTEMAGVKMTSEPHCLHQASVLIFLGLTWHVVVDHYLSLAPSAPLSPGSLLLRWLFFLGLLCWLLFLRSKLWSPFLLYIFVLGDLLLSHGCKCHSCANDFHIYISSSDLSLEHQTQKFDSLLDFSKTVWKASQA